MTYQSNIISTINIFSEQKKFPFRAWFVDAVGMMLLFAFMVKAWAAFFEV